jgi:hypothetical protein
MSLFVLFLRDLSHHLAGWAGVGSTLSTYLPKSVRDRVGLNRRTLIIAAGIFLYIGTYQVWMDERHNVTQLASEKAEFASDQDYWKRQSDLKDDAIRTRDGLLDKNFTVLSETQSSLTKLSNNILDVTKPESLKIIPFYLGLIESSQNTSVAPYAHSFLLLTNRTITPVTMVVTCNPGLVSAGGGILGAGSSLLGGGGGRRAANQWEFLISAPAWAPTNPMIVSVYSADKEITCSFDEL